MLFIEQSCVYKNSTQEQLSIRLVNRFPHLINSMMYSEVTNTDCPDVYQCFYLWVRFTTIDGYIESVNTLVSCATSK